MIDCSVGPYNLLCTFYVAILFASWINIFTLQKIICWESPICWKITLLNHRHHLTYLFFENIITFKIYSISNCQAHGMFLLIVIILFNEFPEYVPPVWTKACPLTSDSSTTHSRPNCSKSHSIHDYSEFMF